MSELGKVSQWFIAHRPSTRRLAQLYAALLYNANLKGFIRGELYTGQAKNLCVPGLNCYSCPGAVAACPLGALQNALGVSNHKAGWYIFGILLLFGVTLGRTVCGWLCPFGLVQDLLHKIPTPKIKKSRITRWLSLLKYLILAVFVIAIPLIYAFSHGMPLPGFCKYICPAGTLEGAFPLLSNPANSDKLPLLGALFTNKVVILAMVILACVFCYRAFCRFICPLGAIYGLFNRFALTGMRVDADRCTRCGACVRVCKTDIRQVGDRECISCGKCMNVCAHGAISLRCGKITLKGPDLPGNENTAEKQKRRTAARVIWGVLLALLVFAVIWFNFIDVPAEEPDTPAQMVVTAEESWKSDAPVGFDVGQQLADFTCTLTDGSEFRLADTRGKIVIINQWATWCTPCVAELPFFEQLQEDHPDDVVVLAFHSWPEVTPDAVSFIREKGWDTWQVRFAVDPEDTPLLRAIGGGASHPRTVVLNRRGEVTYNEPGSISADKLAGLFTDADLSSGGKEND